METLQITKASASAAHAAADANTKKVLEVLFGKEIVVSQKITDRVKTVEDACNILGIDVTEFATSSLYHTPDELAYKKLKVIAKALNEGWEPDWDNSSEYKWYPYYKMSAPGLSFDGAGDWDTNAGVGSRLCFKSRELAEYAGKQFLQLYSTLFII